MIINVVIIELLPVKMNNFIILPQSFWREWVEKLNKTRPRGGVIHSHAENRRKNLHINMKVNRIFSEVYSLIISALMKNTFGLSFRAMEFHRWLSSHPLFLSFQPKGERQMAASLHHFAI